MHLQKTQVMEDLSNEIATLKLELKEVERDKSRLDQTMSSMLEHGAERKAVCRAFSETLKKCYELKQQIDAKWQEYLEEENAQWMRVHASLQAR